ncbi:hypothetical protein J6A34_06345 [bacterium]|nr:hypothetical protein [bacterium]
MIPSIDNNINFKNKNFIRQTNNSSLSFQATPQQFTKGTKFLDGFLKSQENLSSTRFIQGTLTNWFPKAVLSRSFIDFSEFTFLEFLESGIFYFAAPFFGEHLFRNKLFKSVQPKNIKDTVVKNLPQSLDEIKASKVIDKNLKKNLTATKAGVVLACITVPALEYALGFAKNLFTLKVFKVSDFNNVANLSKEKTENLEQQNRVETHSKSVLKKMAALSVAGIGAGLALARFGHKSKAALKFSEALLEPGEQISKLLHKVGLKSEKTDNFLKDYLKLDFVNNNGKLSLSKGQLAVTCITGLFGYSSAAKERGKLDFYEVWTRVPLVVLYTIFGSAILDAGFKKVLADKGKFPELIKRNAKGVIENVPTRKELPKIAEKLSKLNKTSVDEELAKLIKQKAIITGVPYLFSLVTMGFVLSAVSRVWTKYRYNQQQKAAATQTQEQKPQDFVKLSPAFQGFKVSLAGQK